MGRIEELLLYCDVNDYENAFILELAFRVLEYLQQLKLKISFTNNAVPGFQQTLQIPGRIRGAGKTGRPIISLPVCSL